MIILVKPVMLLVERLINMPRIVETDNFGGDYPNEQFVNLPTMPLEVAKKIADTLNEHFNTGTYSRYWKAVENNYILKPGFEP